MSNTIIDNTKIEVKKTYDDGTVTTHTSVYSNMVDGDNTIREIASTEPKPKCPKCNTDNVREWEENSNTVGTKTRLKRCYNPKCRLLAIETWKLAEMETRDPVDVRITKMRISERKDELCSNITSMKKFYVDGNNKCHSITYI